MYWRKAPCSPWRGERSEFAGAYWGVRAFVAFDPIDLPRIQEVAVNPAMLFFTLLVAIATGVLCGLAPAWRSSRQDLNETLKEGSERQGDRPSRTRARSALAIAQIALSIVLLSGGAFCCAASSNVSACPWASGLRVFWRSNSPGRSARRSMTCWSVSARCPGSNSRARPPHFPTIRPIRGAP